MKKLRNAGFIILIATLIVLGLWHRIPGFPDWVVRINGVLMAAGIFTLVFSTVRLRKEESRK